MSTTVYKCGAEYTQDDPFPDEKVDACPRCSNYARTEITTPPPSDAGRVRVKWEPRKPTRVLS